MIIKWLEDPALLNKVLNWYFSVFGVLSIARLFADSTGVIISYAFPRVYTKNGKLWKVSQKRRKTQTNLSPPLECESPLPGWFSGLEFSEKINQMLWTLRGIPSYQFRIRIFAYKVFSAQFRIGPIGIMNIVIAVIAVLYFNFVDKPWWLTNLIASSFAYSALQVMSPTTFSTGTMLMAALFFYDIYFVFFTPLMVTVAKTLDIPAKLLFPRPPGPNDDPDKKSLAMLGLGDIVLPGIVIGLALRFDLYLFYLRKQSNRALPEEEYSEEDKREDELVKVEWQPAAGGWGERFWTTPALSEIIGKEQGGRFPKTYFHAGLFGYSVGLIVTLGVMQVYGHAQPALLYLVPGVLGSIWGTALAKGDIKLMWHYNEAANEEAEEAKPADSKSLVSIFSPSRQAEIAGRVEKQLKGKDNLAQDNDKKTSKNESGNSAQKLASAKTRPDEVFCLSISLPISPVSEQNPEELSLKKEKLKQPSLEDELRIASEDDIITLSSGSGVSASGRSIEERDREPVEKRQKITD